MLLCLCIGAASFTEANAQWLKIGPEVGLNLSTLSTRFIGDKGSQGMRPGLKAGGVIDLGISPHISLQTGLYYSMKGSANVNRRTTSSGNTSVTVENTQDFRVDYLEVPLNLLFRLGPVNKGQVFFGGGPYIATAISGKSTNIQTRTITTGGTTGGYQDINDHKLNIGNSNTDDIRPLDAGVNLTAGYEARRGVFVRANLGMGVVNILPNGNADNYMHNVAGTISIGYLFGKKQ